MNARLDIAAVDVLLCDADGNLFPSEEPAFVASSAVTNRLLAELGVERRYTATELRRSTTGKNFRTTAVDLARAHGFEIAPGELETWVAEEKRRVTAHLARALTPDKEVTEPLESLERRFRLAAVSSSASSRLDACFGATGLAWLFPPEMRYSAEDSLAIPASKPDPAIYLLAGEELGISGSRGLAIEDAVPGVQSAVAAGFPVVGNVMFVPAAERATRAELLLEAGAATVIGGWRELEELLDLAPEAVGR
jgi:beta-phosphoglucomutase-like phosphatase (HAD superfamily)